MALFIGFANKFYTLWEVTSSQLVINENVTRIITNHRFVKNVSFDKHKALTKYPEATFDDTLKGVTKSWKSYKEVWNNINTFRFGRSKYNKIESEDLGYIEWYWNNCPEEQKEYIGNYLINNGYRIDDYFYYNSEGNRVDCKRLVSPKEIELENKEKNEMEALIDSLIDEDTITFTPTKNLSDDGKYYDGKVVYHFQQVKENWYQGCPYYLPLLNGKAKRIKNKKINVNLFDWHTENGNLIIEIQEFEIIK